MTMMGPENGTSVAFRQPLSGHRAPGDVTSQMCTRSLKVEPKHLQDPGQFGGESPQVCVVGAPNTEDRGGGPGP